MHKFPSEFLWGTAASAYQTEGNNINNDWYHYEQIEAKKLENKRKLAGMCGKATMQWQNYEQDYDLAQKMGVKIHRLSIEWSRNFPTPDRPDEEEAAALDHRVDGHQSQAPQILGSSERIGNPLSIECAALFQTNRLILNYFYCLKYYGSRIC